jgi:hypothetical protein
MTQWHRVIFHTAGLSSVFRDMDEHMLERYRRAGADVQEVLVLTPAEFDVLVEHRIEVNREEEREKDSLLEPTNRRNIILSALAARCGFFASMLEKIPPSSDPETMEAVTELQWNLELHEEALYWVRDNLKGEENETAKGGS